MQTYGSSVVPMIEANYEMFTVVEKTIADFLFRMKKRWIFHRDAWQRCYMFQKHLCHALPRKWVTADTGSLFTTTSPRSRSDRMWRNRPSTSCIRMRNCCKNIQLNPRTTDQTCVPANRGTYAHFLYGFGSSGLAAQEFQLRLLRLGMDAEAITELHQMVLNEARITNACLVIGISLSGATRELIDALDRAKARGAAVIYLTSSNAEREKRTYEEIVLAPVKRTSNTEMSFPRNFRSC